MSTILRAPVEIRGDVPGLLVRGMPVPDADGDPCVYQWSQDNPSPDYWRLDWSDRAAVLLSLAWLADHGHQALWMLPTTHGGRIEAWDGLSAWEVSAILVSVSVRRVAAGGEPVADLALPDALDWIARGLVDCGGAALVPGGVEVSDG